MKDVTKINDAIIEESDIFIYNLGTVFVIDRVLFVDHERISQVLSKNADRIPSFGFVGPDGASSVSGDGQKTSDIKDATTAVDLLAELTGSTESTAGKLVVRE